MEQYTVEDFLNNMHLKTRRLGGYDQEDVLLKMKELVEVAQYQAENPHQAEELKKQRQECEALQAKVQQQEEKIHSLEQGLEKEQQKNQLLEKKATQLKQEIHRTKKLQASENNELDQLRSYVADMEREKESILRKHISQVSEDEIRIKAENERLSRANEELRETVNANCKKVVNILDQLIDMAMTFKYQIMDVGNDEEYR